MNKKLLAVILILYFSFSASGQLKDHVDQDCNPNRLKYVIGTEAIGYSATMFGLYHLWYKDYDLESFHFFNDIEGWMYIDKFGHTLSAYYVGRLGYDVLKWACVPEKKAVWYGGTLGLMFLTTVEIFDGISAGWGASTWDLAHNTLGAGIFIGQQLLWQEQYLTLKFSYSHSPYQKHNPDVLGHNFQERLLKDYNGQTFWYSFNMKPLFPETNWMPEWLNLALGYGADGMLNGYNDTKFETYSQYYLSFDIDYSKIETKSKFLKSAFELLNFIKFPFPALEYNRTDHLKFHWLHF